MQSAGRGPKAAFAIMVGYCVILIAFTAMPSLAGMFSKVSDDYGEGWNAYWALAVQKGLPLYSTHRAFAANNYPPLSFYINAALGSAIGDNIIAGRLIALVSLLGVAGLIARILSTLGAPLRWALVSSTIFLLYNLIYFRQMVAIDNPQWLGEFVALACVIPLTRRPPDSLRFWEVVSAATIMVVAGLIKHNQFALPLSVTIWLLLYNRRACAIWIVSGAVLSAVACLFLYAAYGPAVFSEIMQYKRTMSVPTFKLGLAKTGSLAALIIIATLSLYWQRANPRAALLLLYAFLGVVFGIVQRLGSGVYINAHDDALIGLVLACGAFLGLASAGAGKGSLSPWRSVALLAVILFPVFIVTPKHIRQTLADVRHLPAQRLVWAEMIADVQHASSPAFCEMLSVCYWAGQPLQMDFFAYGERLKTGLDPSPLQKIIASRAATILVVDRTPNVPPSEKRLPPPFPALIDLNYAVKRTDLNGIAVMQPVRK